MPYTSPSTVVTGTTITSAWGNSVKAGLDFLANKPACRIYNGGAAQSFTDAVEATVTFTAKRFDNDSMWSAGSPNRITIQTAGVYAIGFHGQFAAANDYVNGYGIIRLNGTTYISLAGSDQSVVGVSDFQIQTATLYKFSAGDYIEVRGLQNNTASAARNLSVGTAFSPEFWAVWESIG